MRETVHRVWKLIEINACQYFRGVLFVRVSRRAVRQ